ncbi:chromosome segregation protein SMC [Candidatus Woesearchaeota archaeon]|nr:chromosome segregation protein SMC [Candidatus Woesearchaeota archaeon]
MIKINCIVIHGFKSFAHETEIPFTDKFNCILGPNGSGKSNIGDAICFVLGRLSTKSMRVEKAANLIFNGGKSKKAGSSATVEIVFCNKNHTFPVDAREVSISRTISTDGSSVYRINSKKHTRTEILDLLSAARINPEGYNIILQGDITRFVDMSPLDRRKIIEEISDVSMYEEKKHKALLELNKVEEKLNNATIILQERKTHLKELKKDRDQALKFKEIRDKIDSYKATRLHLYIQEKEDLKQQYDKDVSKYQEQITSAEKEIEKLKHKLNEHKQTIFKINQEIEHKGEKEQLQVHREIEDLKVSLARDKTRVSTLKDEINKIQQRKDQFQQEIKELSERSSSSKENKKEIQQQIGKKNRELQDIERSISEFKKKNKIESSQELDQEIEDKDKLIEQKQEEVQQIRQKQQELLREKDRLEFQLESIEERIKKVKEVEQQNKSQIKELQQKKSDFKAATLRLNQCLEQDSSLAMQLSNARKKLSELQETQAKLNSRTIFIQADLLSNKALASILDNRKRFKGVHGTISELGQVNKKYALALESAAGNRMQNIVVDNENTAAECIKYLKNNKLGSASFIPLNKIRSQEISAEDKKLAKLPGVHDFAINLISFKPQFHKAFGYVFGNTLVVEDINTTIKVGINRIKMTTLDGDVAEASGVMKGGFVSRKATLGFQEKDSLEELEKSEKEISSKKKKKSELEAEIIKLEKRLHLDTDDLNATEDLKKELRIKLKEINENLTNVQKEVTSTNKELAELKTRKQMLRSEVNELRNPRLLAQLSAFEEAKQKFREDLLILEGEMKTLSAQEDQLITPEIEKIKEILKQHDKEEIQFTQEIKKLAEKITANEKELQGREKDSTEFYSKYKELFARREKLNSEVNQKENEIESFRERIRNNERELNLISLKNAEVKAKLAGLQEEFSRYKNAEIMKNKKLDTLQEEINKFEVMLLQMSAVNMKALEIYEQVEKEFNELVDKRDSLDKEKIDILTLMNEIETKKKEHFMQTFDKANENFQKIFTSLFHKGKAYLQLENPDRLFEEGLCIKVKLTGNRFMDIKSLSGGEKTLTALSFIFAIQEYQPASFYILDEIDAALDKHNSETLAKLIRNYCNNAQYIIISHNDAIISEADTLYGISMNEEGISKVTSLKI